MTIPEVSPRASLRHNLVESFSLEELVLLCDDLGVDSEIIPGSDAGKAYWASQIIGYFVHEDRIDDLLKRAAELRPTVDWSYEPGDEELDEDEYVEPARRPLFTRKRLLALGLGGLAVAVMLGFLVWSAKMNGLFNVVVADFGQLESDGRVQPSQDGQRLAQLMYEALENEFNTLDTTNAQIFKPLVWRRGLIRDEKEAKELAERIGADVVIFGVLSPGQTTGAFVPTFYVSALHNEAEEMVGEHSLGAPIPFRLPLTTAELRAVNTVITYRQKLFANFTLGVMYDVIGQHERALTILTTALDDLNSQAQTEGRAVLLFMIGRAHLFLRRPDQAETAFRSALANDSQYARAYVGLGGVYFQRAEAQAPTERITNPQATDAAFDNYKTALNMAEREAEKSVADKARLGLAYVYRLRGEGYLHTGEWALADADLTEAEAIIQPMLVSFEGQYRLLAQSYATLGAAYHQHAYSRQMAGDIVGARRLYNSALTAYASCITQGNLNPNDLIITGPEGIVRLSCRPQQEAVRQALIALE